MRIQFNLQKLAYWSFVGWGNQVIQQIIGIILIPIFLDYITPESYGVWILISSSIVWISYAEFGLTQGLIRELSKIDKNERPFKVKDLLISTVRSLFLLALAFLLVYLVSYPFIFNYLGIDVNLVNPVSVFVFFVLCEPIIKIFGAVLESNEEFFIRKSVSLIAHLLASLLTVFLLYVDLSIKAFIISYIFKNLLVGFTEMFFVLKKKLLINSAEKPQHNTSSIFNFGLKFQLNKLSNSVILFTDVFFIQYVSSTADVTAYSITTKLGQVFGIGLVSMIPSLLFPRVASNYSNNTIEEVKELIIDFMSVIVRFSLIISIANMIFNSVLVDLWMGEEFYLGTKVNLVLSLWILTELLLRGTIGLAMAVNGENTMAALSVLEVVLNLFLTILLIDNFGIVGVISATIISRLPTLLFGPYKILFKALEITRDQLKWEIMKPLMIMIICMMPCLISFIYGVSVLGLVLLFSLGVLLSLYWNSDHEVIKKHFQ